MNSKEQICNLYYDENLTQSEIGKKLGYTQQGISKIMKKNDIKTNHYWSEVEEGFLRDNYKKLGVNEIGFELKRSKGAIYTKAWKMGLTENPQIFWKPLNSYSLAYILGVILGDGYVSKKLSKRYKIGLNVKDKEFAEAFHNALLKIGLKAMLKLKKDNWWVWSCNKNFCEWFNNLTLNQIISIIEENDLIPPFIRGMYDSDGSFEIRNKKYGYHSIIIYNTDESLLECIRELLYRIGISSVLSLKRKAGRISVRNDGIKIISRKRSYGLGIYAQKEIQKFLIKIGSNIPRKAGEKWLRQS